MPEITALFENTVPPLPDLAWVGDPNLQFSLEPGESAPFTLQVVNQSAADVLYTFASTPPAGYSVTLDNGIYQRNIQPSETHTLNGQVHADATVEPDTMADIPVTITW